LAPNRGDAVAVNPESGYELPHGINILLGERLGVELDLSVKLNGASGGDFLFHFQKQITFGNTRLDIRREQGFRALYIDR
jgi:hypothetical protein